MGIYVSRCLKEELILAADKRLWTVSNNKELKNKAIFTILYALLCGPWVILRDSEIFAKICCVYYCLITVSLYHI